MNNVSIIDQTGRFLGQRQCSYETTLKANRRISYRTAECRKVETLCSVFLIR